MLIHVIQNREQTGPHTPAQFDELLQAGKLVADDLYWHEGVERWLPVSGHPNFPQPLAVVSSSPPPPPNPVRRAAHPATPLNTCPSCGHAVAKSATNCPHCGGRLKRGCLTKLAMGDGVLVALYLVLCLLYAVFHRGTPQTQHQTALGIPPVVADAPQRPQAAGAPLLPGAEATFIKTVESYTSRYAAAGNELQKSAVRTERRAALARTMKDLRVSGWVGTLKKLETMPDGKASVSIQLEGSATSVRTSGNPFDRGSSTLIEHGSALYNQLASLSVGDRVTFSGTFLPSEPDYLKENSFTEAGSMTKPEFVLRFTEVEAAPATLSAQPGVTRPPTLADAAPPGVLAPVPDASSSTATPPELASPASVGLSPGTASPSNEELLAQARQILRGDHPERALILLRSIRSDDPSLIAAVALEEEKITPRAGRAQWQRLYELGEKAGPLYELARVHLAQIDAAATPGTTVPVPGSLPDASASPTVEAAPSPRAIVTDFYTWYLAAVRGGRSPWLGGELAARSEISHAFAVRLENAKEPEPGDDPVFAAHEVPGSFAVEADRVNGFDATVAVRLAFGPDRRLVNVRLTRTDEGEPWRIDDVQPVLADNPAPSSSPPPSGGQPAGGDLTRIRLTEDRLNAAYGQLRARLDARRKAVLKQEEVTWIKRKDALAADDPQRIDLIERRIAELAHWGEPTTSNGVNQGFVSAPAVAEPTTSPTSTSATATSDASPWATGSWPVVLYKGNKVPWQLPLPGYWHLMPQPLDTNADAAWEGPKGIVLTAYSFDEDDTDDFWDALKKSAHVTRVKGPPLRQKLPRNRTDTSLSYEADAEMVGGLKLRFVVLFRVPDRPDKLLALSVRMPAGLPQMVLNAVEFDLGYLAGSEHGLTVYAAHHPGKPSRGFSTVGFTQKNDALLSELAKAESPQNPTESAVMVPAILTKAQWKEKMARSFRYFPGTPVIGSAQQFQQIMGKPERTQTVGDRAYWYYPCADGTIQLVMNVLNLQMAGLIQADVNDY